MQCIMGFVERGCLRLVYVYYTVYSWLNVECRLMQLDSEIEMLCIFD